MVRTSAETILESFFKVFFFKNKIQRTYFGGHLGMKIEFKKIGQDFYTSFKIDQPGILEHCLQQSLLARSYQSRFRHIQQLCETRQAV